MRKHFFWLRYPDPLTREPREDRIELALEGESLPERPLEVYIKERGLKQFWQRMHIDRAVDRVPLHFWYVPQSGDVIRCVLRSPVGTDE
jgi:hypothetical protein